MSYSTLLVALLQPEFVADVEQLANDIRDVIHEQEDELIRTVIGLVLGEVTPVAMMEVEVSLAAILRECGRRLVEEAVNRIEPDDAAQLPDALTINGDTHTPNATKTPHSDVCCYFGKITLFRFGWRTPDHTGPTTFPLEESLGLIRGCTPALAERAAWLAGNAGATQRLVIERLKKDHNVSIGHARLRALWKELSERLEPFRRQQQARRIVELLTQADASRGRCRPVLAVGRDGVTVGEQPHGFFEVATCATVTVYDRRGKRLGTVYLGYAPQLGQDTMTTELKLLLEEIFKLWTGRLPRLCYVTDCGSQEEAFYRRDLCHMRHPVTKKRLSWQRIVDFYHATLRLATIAKSLKLDETQARAWQRRMRGVLLEKNGVKRVLMSAAALRKQYKLKPGTLDDFTTAINYLRKRTKWMRYDQYRRQHLPIGSGVTEAGCKTVFTQRAKLSGMRWKKEGLQVILTFRMLIVSDVWSATWSESLRESDPPRITTYPQAQGRPSRFQPRNSRKTTASDRSYPRDVRSIRAETHAVDRSRMPLEGVEFRTRQRVPQPDCLIQTSRGDARAIRAETDTGHMF